MIGLAFVLILAALVMIDHRLHRLVKIQQQALAEIQGLAKELRDLNAKQAAAETHLRAMRVYYETPTEEAARL